MWDRSPTRLSLLHMLPAIADQRGVPLGPLLGQAGLAPDATFERGVIVARAQICALLLRLARSAGEPTVGLDLAAVADPQQLGVSGRALFAGRTLRDCLVGQARNMPDLQGGVELQLSECEGIAFWSHHLVGSDPEHARVLNEGIAGFMAKALTAIVGIDPEELDISFPHRAHAPARMYDDKLGARRKFGLGDRLVFSFDSRWLDRPNRLIQGVAHGDDRLHSGSAPQLADDADSRGSQPLLAMIHRRYESAPSGEAPSLVDTARSLGISPRSLQRRLAAFDTSFEGELDRWRHRRARQLLTEAGQSVGSISRALGYGHPAHFNRAFWRWESRTPTAFRRSMSS